MKPLDRHLTDAEAQGLVDGALPDAETAEVERHAAGCAACQATVATYRMLSGALGDLGVPELPADFTEGVLARVEARERAVARERWHAAAILAGVLVATVAAFAAAGASAWAPVVSSAADLLGGAVRVVRIGSSFVPEVLGALRFQIVLTAAVLALPLLLALNRLVPAPRREIA